MRIFALILCSISFAGCSMGQLKRTDDSPLTASRAASYSESPQQAQSYNRRDLNSLYLVDYGVVIDKNKVKLDGTSETGAKVGGAVGTLNAINRGTNSTESAIIRILGGAVLGAAIENSLTQGEAIEHIIERRDGQLVSLINKYSIPINACVMMRTDSSTQKTSLEVKSPKICDRTLRRQAPNSSIPKCMAGDGLSPPQCRL